MHYAMSKWLKQLCLCSSFLFFVLFHLPPCSRLFVYSQSSQRTDQINSICGLIICMACVQLWFESSGTTLVRTSGKTSRAACFTGGRMDCCVISRRSFFPPLFMAFHKIGESFRGDSSCRCFVIASLSRVMSIGFAIRYWARSIASPPVDDIQMVRSHVASGSKTLKENF